MRESVDAGRGWRSFLTWAGRLAAVAALASGVAAPARAQDGDLLVFAAASLKNALDEVDAQWARDAGKTAVVSYAGSSALARQIQQGAPADVFISADLDWMDSLADRSLVAAATRSNLPGNRPVPVAPRARAVHLPIAPGLPPLAPPALHQHAPRDTEGQ